MVNQTTQNNEDNRDKNSPEELFEEICSIWQEFVDNYRTFTVEIKCDIGRIREILDTLHLID